MKKALNMGYSGLSIPSTSKRHGSHTILPVMAIWSSSDGFLDMLPISNHFRRHHHTHSILYRRLYLYLRVMLSRRLFVSHNHVGARGFFYGTYQDIITMLKVELGWPGDPIHQRCLKPRGATRGLRKDGDAKGGSKSKDGALSRDQPWTDTFGDSQPGTLRQSNMAVDFS